MAVALAALVLLVPTGTAVAGSSVATKEPMPRDEAYAPYLPSARHFSGRSIKNTLLSDAAYSLTRQIGYPKTIAVACWSEAFWPLLSSDTNDALHPTLGFWSTKVPRWVHLSPQVCRAFETLLGNRRPEYPNVFTAEAVATLAHEVMHSMGVGNEAVAECLAMQLSPRLGYALGLSARYSNGLARLTLNGYRNLPPEYVNLYRCREDGDWDIYKNQNSPPWHTYNPNVSAGKWVP